MEMTDEELESTEITRTLISRILGQTHEPCEKVYSPLLVCLKILLRRASQLTQKWNEAINDEQLRHDLVKILAHIRDTPVLPQERAVIPANHSLAKLNASGDGSQSAASNTLHVLSVNNFDKSKKSNLAMASQKLASFSVPVHELLGLWKAITSADE